jgi:hypothetical protein
VTRDLWQQVERALYHHRKSAPTGLHALQRLWGEWLNSEQVPRTEPLAPDSAGIAREMFPPEKFASARRRHDRCAPKQEIGAIIVVEHCGTMYVIDGNNRVNQWIRDNRSSPVDAIVIRPRLVEV